MASIAELLSANATSPQHVTSPIQASKHGSESAAGDLKAPERKRSRQDSPPGMSSGQRSSVAFSSPIDANLPSSEDLGNSLHHKKTLLTEYQIQIIHLEQLNKRRLMAARPKREAHVAQYSGDIVNGSLEDHQMQLRLLEQQNKRRLMAARQGTDVRGHVYNPVTGAGPSSSNDDCVSSALLVDNEIANRFTNSDKALDSGESSSQSTAPITATTSLPAQEAIPEALAPFPAHQGSAVQHQDQQINAADPVTSNDPEAAASSTPDSTSRSLSEPGIALVNHAKSLLASLEQWRVLRTKLSGLQEAVQREEKEFDAKQAEILNLKANYADFENLMPESQRGDLRNIKTRACAAMEAELDSIRSRHKQTWVRLEDGKRGLEKPDFGQWMSSLEKGIPEAINVLLVLQVELRKF